MLGTLQAAGPGAGMLTGWEPLGCRLPSGARASTLISQRGDVWGPYRITTPLPLTILQYARQPEDVPPFEHSALDHNS